MKFTKHTLKNGLRTVFVPMQDTQTVTCLILVDAGSKYESRQINGLSHFLEHMMFKGTKNRPTSQIITEQLDSVGGEYNAFTGKEQTGYWIKVSKQHFELALDVVSDLYLNPLLSEKEIEKERGVILQEAAMYRDTPHRYVWDVFENLLYGDQPAGWDIIGTEENIKKLQKKDFEKYFKGMYTPESTIMVVAGNFDEEKALKMIEKSFGKRKSSRKNAKKKTIEKQAKPQLDIFQKETDQTHLIVGVRAANMFSPERYATVVLGTILGGGMSSRMFHNIREKFGLTYYIDAASEQMTDTGYLFTRAGVQQENLEKAVKLILDEFNKIKNEKISEKELNKAKEYIKGKTLMSLESSSSVAHFFGDQVQFRNKIQSVSEIFSKIDSVSAEQIMRVSSQIFKPKNLNLAVVGPISEQEKDRLKKVLTF